MTEYIYLGRDNKTVLQLKVAGTAEDISGATRMTLNFNGTIVDSDTSPTAFDWSLGSGKVELALKNESIWAGTYRDENAVELVVYDPSNTDGIVWGKINCIVQEKSAG